MQVGFMHEPEKLRPTTLPPAEGEVPTRIRFVRLKADNPEDELELADIVRRYLNGKA